MRARTGIAIVAALLSALGLWASSAALGAGPLAWAAVLPVAATIAAWPGTRPARLAVPLAYALYLELLLVPSLPFGLAEGQFGDPLLPLMVGGSPVLFVALIAIPLLGGLLYALGFGCPPRGARRALDRGGGNGSRRDDRAAALSFVALPAAAWTALELLRARLDPAGFWGPLHQTQAATGAGDLASLAGPWALTFLIVASGYGLALAVVRRNPVGLVPVALAAAAFLVPAPPPSEAPTVRVAAVQPGFDTAAEDRAVLARFEPGEWDASALDLISHLGALSARAAERGAELIVWPEASFYADPRRDPGIAGALRGLATELGASIVVPFFRPFPERQSGVLAVTAPRGGIPRLTGARPKQRPMWFLDEGAIPVPVPDAEQPLQVDGVAVGTMLGVDSQDPAVAAGLAGDGAELLAAPSHDWRQSAPHHAAATRLAGRAVALPLVRADWRYGSAIWDRGGRELAAAPDGLWRGVVVAEVGPGPSRAGYATIGDAVGWACLAVAGAWLAAGLGGRLRRRAREEIPEAGRGLPRPARRP